MAHIDRVRKQLDDAQADYGIRCGDDLGLYAEHNIAHPVTWANLANSVFIENLVTGPWIHVRSKIYHEGVAQIGATVRAEATLLDRFESRAGERALVVCAERPGAAAERVAVRADARARRKA